MQALSCYLCRSRKTRLAFKKLSHEIWLCADCGLYFLKFDYNYNKFIKDYYQKGYFTGNKKLRAYADYEGDQRTIKMNMRNYLKHIKNHVGARSSRPGGKTPPLQKKLLDCGCAMGYFMEEAVKAGFDPYGIDISRYAADKAIKTFPNRIFIGPVEKIDKIISSPSSPNIPNLPYLPNRPFDIITMFDLIEHLQNPRLVLQKLSKLLKKDGIIVLQTGDVSSRWAKRQGVNWHFFAPPQHLNFFSRYTITDLLNQSGFKVVSIETEGKWVSLRYLFHMMRYANSDRIGDFLYKLTRHNKIGKIPVLFKFGDNMIVIAKKLS